jgi:hypothetical protein
MLASNVDPQDAYESDLSTAIQNKAIALLDQFVRLIGSHATIEIQNAPEVYYDISIVPKQSISY